MTHIYEIVINKVFLLGREETMEIENELVSRAKKGDKEAFSEIYSQIYKDMYRYAYYVLENAEDAEDAVSETVMDAYKSLGKLKDDSLFKNWIFKILSNKCKKKRKQYLNKTLPLDADIKTKEDDCDSRYDMVYAFSSLDEQEKTVVSMAVFAGYKSHEIGEYLNLNPATVRSKLSRALGKIQKKMEVI